jgi:hypothetical protein
MRKHGSGRSSNLGWWNHFIRWLRKKSFISLKKGAMSLQQLVM